MGKQKILSILAGCLLAPGLAFALASCELFEEEETRYYLNFQTTNNYPDTIISVEAYPTATSNYEPDNARISSGSSKTFNIWISESERGRSFEIRVYVSEQPDSYASIYITQADNMTHRLMLNANGTLIKN